MNRLSLKERSGTTVSSLISSNGGPCRSKPLVRLSKPAGASVISTLGGTLRSELDPWDRADDDEILQAISVANAEDILEALPEGLDADVDERGRSFSGGQRQRVALARALLADPEVLVLVEPTSAVDAHTEARIARRLRDARAGRTTVIAATSPLVLDQADKVVLVRGGRVVAEGTHRGLLADRPDYRETVTRGEDL